MATILKGAPIAAEINEETARAVARLKEKNVVPTLAILRLGEKESDLSYERGARKRCEALGVGVRSVVLPEDVESGEFFSVLGSLNADKSVHGILMLRPLPRHIDDEAARAAISPEKDVDGCTVLSLAGVFTGADTGFPPCTAQAAVEMLDRSGIDCKGKNAVVLGRSLVVGRPVAMLLMHRNATVTVCHTRTVGVEKIAAGADILIACTGKTESVGADYVNPSQIVIDVGISWNEQKQKLCGDADFDAVADRVAAITPVPGGVGAVTTAVLVSHVAAAALRACGLAPDK